MNCPLCQERAVTRGGGGATITGKIRRYYRCRECGCDFEVIDGVIRIQDAEPLLFRNRREALHVLYRAVHDDREWFGAVTPETEATARTVFVQYLIGNRSKPAASARQHINFRRGVGWARLER